MTSYYLFHQKNRKIEFVTHPENEHDACIETIMENVFPDGDSWSNFVGARSFKLFQVLPGIYGLSYTFVLGRDQNCKNGTLHTWCVVDHAEVLMDLWARRKSPHDVFIHLGDIFAQDPYLEPMLSGLDDRLPHNIVWPNWKPLFSAAWWYWAGAIFGLQFGFKARFLAQFSDNKTWSITENLIGRSYRQTIWKARIMRIISGLLALIPPFYRRPVELTPFVTLTLSYYARSRILGIPE